MHPPPEPDVLLSHRAFMVAVARELMGDAHRAEDVAQEGLLAAWRSPPRGPHVRGWFRAVTRNLVFLGQRRDARRVRRERIAARGESEPSTAERVARVELQRRIVEAVLGMSEPYRSCVIARYLEDRPVAAIAAAEGVSRETVKTRLRRALAQLRRELDDAHGGDSRVWSSLLLPLVAGPSAAPPGRAVPASVPAAGAILMTKTKLLGAAGIALLLLLFIRLHSRDDDPAGTRSARAPKIPRDDSSGAVESVPKEELDTAGPVDRGLDLHGVVVDPAGEPVRGADLTVVHRGWDRAELLASRPGTSGIRTRSAADGTFRLRLRRGALVTLRVHANGFAPVELRRLQSGERVRVVLAAPATLGVTVRDAARTPVAGARVRLRRTKEGGFVDRLGRSGRDGTVRFEDLPRGMRVVVEASHPEHGSPLEPSAVEAPGDVEIVLPPGRLFEGQVLDAVTKAPVPGARIGMNWYMDPETTADGEGRFFLNGFSGPTLFHSFHVRARGYGAAFLPIRGVGKHVIELRREVRIRGRILDDAGRPLAGVRVAALGGAIRGSYSADYVTTNDDGRFELAGLAPGMPHNLSVATPGRARLSRRVEAGEPGTRIDVGDLTLVAGRTIAGQVLTETDSPVRRCEIELRGPAVPGLIPRNHFEVRRTDDLGRFRFPDLPAGRYVLTAKRLNASGVQKTVVLRQTDVDGVVLQVAVTRVLTVRVVSEHGDPIQKAELIVDDEVGSSRTFTDEKGAARFQVRGRVRRVRLWHVFATDDDGPHPYYGPAEPLLDLPESVSEAEMVVPIWVPIQGRALRNREPFPHGVVELTWDGGRKETTTGSTGHFRTLVPPGTVVTLRVTGQERKTGRGFIQDRSFMSEPVRAAAGTEGTELRVLPVPRDRTLLVRVNDPTGAPLPGVQVAYGPTLTKTSVDVRTDETGIARMTALPALRITLYVLLPEDATYLAPRFLQLIPDGQEVTLTCRTVRRMRGRVLRKDGQPAAGARLSLSIDGEDFGWDTDAKGRFDVPVPLDAKSIDLHVTWQPGDGGARESWVLDDHPAADPLPEIQLEAEDG